MALLLLWEVDHGQPFPSLARDNQASRLAGFTRRLKDRVARDEELKEWLECKYMQLPLAPGLPASHHSRWSVKVAAPPGGTEVGWYNFFVERWKAYLRSLSGPRQGPEAATEGAMPNNVGNRRGRVEEAPPGEHPKRRRAAPPSWEAPVVAAAPQAEVPALPVPLVGQANQEGVQTAPPRKRSASLAGWLLPRPAKKGPHGRASEGPPT